MFKFLSEIGKYFILLGNVFSKPDKKNIFRQQLVFEIDKIGIDSLGIVMIISIFMGGVVAIQTAFNIDSPWFPLYSVGYTVRQSVILEFSPTIVSLILAGKVGSRIASEIGTMRVTEQIDAMEVSAINPFKYLVVTRVFATTISIFLLSLHYSFFGLLGAYTNVYSNEGISIISFLHNALDSIGFLDIFTFIFKSIVYGFTIGIVGTYKGFNATQGTRGVGKAANQAVVLSIFLIFIEELLIVQVANVIRYL